MFADHEWLAARKLDVSDFVHHGIQLIPEVVTVPRPCTVTQHLIMEALFLFFSVGDEIYFFRGECRTRPRATDTAFEVTDVAQLEIQEHQRSSIYSPWLIVDPMFETIKGVHSF